MLGVRFGSVAVFCFPLTGIVCFFFYMSWGVVCMKDQPPIEKKSPPGCSACRLARSLALL